MRAQLLFFWRDNFQLTSAGHWCLSVSMAILFMQEVARGGAIFNWCQLVRALLCLPTKFLLRENPMQRSLSSLILLTAVSTFASEVRIQDLAITREKVYEVPRHTSNGSERSVTAGNYPNAITSGNYPNAVTSGNYPNAVTSGNFPPSPGTISGNFPNSITSGDFPNAVTSGNSPDVVISGNFPSAAMSDEEGSITNTNWPNMVLDGNHPSMLLDANYPSMLMDSNFPDSIISGTFPNSNASRPRSERTTELPMPQDLITQ